jgi:hypothetical protein
MIDDILIPEKIEDNTNSIHAEIIEEEVVNIELTQEEIQDVVETSQELIPAMNVNLQLPPEEEKIISDEKLVGLYDEVLNNIREDRKEISDYISKFSDMILNEGDATSASKEALINLVSAKLNSSDKMSKIADLMTRVRGTNTFPKYLATNQNNTINIENRKLSSSEKRALIEAENKKREKLK